MTTWLCCLTELDVVCGCCELVTDTPPPCNVAGALTYLASLGLPIPMPRVFEYLRH